MPVSRSSINSFARTMKQAGDTSSLWAPRPPQWSMELSTIAGVDVGNSRADVTLNGSDDVAYGVRYVHFYGPDHTPEEGHTAWGFYNGKVMMLVGRQNVPNGPVVLP